MGDELDQTVSLTSAKRGASLGRRQPCLKVLAGEGAGQVVVLSSAPTSLGRSKTSGIVVDVTGVSRLHAHFELGVDDSISLRDNDSTNGTFVNGRRTQEQMLQEGDLVGLDRMALVQLLFLTPQELELARRLHEQNTGDPATGLYNQRHLLERIEQEIALNQRSQLSASLVVASPEDFSRFSNDAVLSQSLLRSVAERLERITATEDALARLEGSTFAVLLRGKDLKQAEEFAALLRDSLNEPPFPANAQRARPVQLKARVGVVELGQQSTPQELLEAGLAEMEKALSEENGISARPR